MRVCGIVKRFDLVEFFSQDKKSEGGEKRRSGLMTLFLNAIFALAPNVASNP